MHRFMRCVNSLHKHIIAATQQRQASTDAAAIIVTDGNRRLTFCICVIILRLDGRHIYELYSTHSELMEKFPFCFPA